jgi:hypothetical protein
LDKNENNYFAKVLYKKKQLLRHQPLIPDESISLFKSVFPTRDSENKTTIISGFESTIDVPFKLIEIEAEPTYLNIDMCSCKIVFVVSPVEIRFFYLYSNFKLEDWENYRHNYSSGLQTVEVEMKDFNKVKETISNILIKFESFVLDPIKAKYL